MRGSSDPTEVDEIRWLRATMPQRLKTADVVADAVVAIYQSKVFPGVTLDQLAVIADVDLVVLKRAVLRRLDRLSHPVTHKRCLRCLEKKPADAFAKWKRSADGLQAWCNACHVEYDRDRAVARAAADEADAKAAEVTVGRPRKVNGVTKAGSARATA